MNAAASAALAPESFSALALFLRADWVVKGVVGNMNATKQSTGDKSPVVAYRADYSISEYSGIGFAGVHGKAANLVQDTGNTGLKSINLCEGLLRMAGRNFKGVREPTRPGEVYDVMIGVGQTSLVVPKGHRGLWRGQPCDTLRLSR